MTLSPHQGSCIPSDTIKESRTIGEQANLLSRTCVADNVCRDRQRRLLARAALRETDVTKLRFACPALQKSESVK